MKTQRNMFLTAMLLTVLNKVESACEAGLKEYRLPDGQVICSKTTCTPEAVLDNSTGKCRCDEKKGYTGDDPLNCGKAKKCRPNTYLKNGSCQDCPAGTERPGLGYWPCTPLTMSASNVTSATPATTNTDPGVIVASVVLSLIVVGILITVFWCKRNKAKKSTKGQGQSEDGDSFLPTGSSV